MPYLIKTNDRSVAVATLDEARKDALNVIRLSDFRGEWMIDWVREARDLPEQGGTVGPLPDGSLITVESVSWRALAGGPWSPEGDWQTRLLDAYNAREDG